MAFWTEQANEPKRNFRFLVEITRLGDNGADSVQWWARSFKVPSYIISETTHDFMDNKFYYPGRLTWDDVTLNLVDPAGDKDVIKKTMSIITNAGYDIRENPTTTTNQNAMATISKQQFSANASSLGPTAFIIEILDEAGAVIETWTLNNPFLKAVDFDTMSYDSDELRSISMTVAFDWATCNVGGTEFLPKA